MKGHTDPVRSVAFSSDGLRIASGSFDNTVRIWDTVSGTIQHTLEGHIGPVSSVAFSSDGLHIISGSRDYTMRIWDTKTGSIQHVLDEYQDGQSLRAFLAASTLPNGWHILNEHSSPFTHHSHLSTEIIMDRHGSRTTSDLDVSEGWVFRIALDGTRRRMCWLPHKR
jgi:WD40 repeat protein